MAWKLDSDRPIHLQLQEKLRLQIVSGVYPPGTKLPSVRDLAADAGVNPNTMQRALAELENRELIRTERTTGRYVTEDKEMVTKTRDEIALSLLKGFITKMEELGFSKKEILQFVRSHEEEKNG
ncbi:MAG: GntR family transcriptional regulator [Lachnospiraceae bacterium]|nr:GntR family transcriptional regulator [Lachnospiraceae bacterium]